MLKLYSGLPDTPPATMVRAPTNADPLTGMDIADFLTQDHVVLDLRARDKTQVLSEAARLLASDPIGLKADAIESALLAREALGSTGLGNGFALPHARVESLTDYRSLFLRLAKPVPFDAIDDKPVDLVFVLLIPFVTPVPHVSALAAISRRFRDAERVASIRKAAGAEAVYALLTGA